jgi:Na+/melibiose symporter-like transporter
MDRKTGVTYAMGHIIVDLAGGCWLTYGLLYVREVVRIDYQIAKYVMLIGQMMFAFAVVAAGILSDKYGTRIGKKMPWYILGVSIAVPTFIAIFMCPNFVEGSLG